MANNQNRGGNAQQGNRGGQQRPTQPQTNQPAQQPRQQSQGGNRLAISGLFETPTELTVIVKAIANNSPAPEATPVYFNLGGGAHLTAVKMTDVNGEAKYAYTKQPGVNSVTIKATAKIGGDVSLTEVYVFDKPLAKRAPVPEAPKTPKPIPAAPFMVKTHERFGDDENRWYTMVGIKVQKPTRDQTVTVTGRILGTEPRNRNLNQVLTLDANGTAFADFEAQLEVPFLTVLASTKGCPPQTLTIERPALSAGISAWVEHSTLIENENGTFSVEFVINGKVKHDIWRDNRRVSVWITGAEPQFVRTHDGLFEATFIIYPDLVPDLGDIIRFGALLVGTDAECSGSRLTPEWKPEATAFAHGISRRWWNHGDFGLTGTSFHKHIRDVDSSIHSIINCSIMLLLWAATMFGIDQLVHPSFWFVPLPAYGIAWLAVVSYWWLVEDIMHQRRRIWRFAWTFGGLIAFTESCFFVWSLTS